MLVQSFELVVSQIAIAQNLSEQTGADGFAGVDGDSGDAAVGVTQTMMASLRSDYSEAGFLQRANQLFTSDSFSARHQATRTCWTPMNVRRGGRDSSARHTAIASCTRRINTSNDLACVWQPRSSGTVATK